MQRSVLVVDDAIMQVRTKLQLSRFVADGFKRIAQQVQPGLAQ